MLRRPMLYVAVVYTAAILIAHYGGFRCAITIVTACTIGACYHSYKKHERKRNIFVWLLALSVLTGFLNYEMHTYIKDPIESMLIQKGEKTNNGEIYLDGACVNGTVNAVENKTEMQQLTLSSDGGGKCLIRVYEDHIDVAPGQKLRVMGRLMLLQGRKNPNCFDYRLYLKTKGISTVMNASSFELIGDNTSVEGALYRWKEGYLNRINESVGEETSGIMRAILFGEKTDLDEDVQEVFQRNGTAHILAVSGLHIGIIYGVLLKLWSLIMGIMPIAIRPRGKGFICFIGVFFMSYMVLANYSPSVVRAVIMVLLHAYAQVTNRRYDLLSAAIVVSLATLIRSPMMIFNTGFQMSFLAVLTMTLTIPYIKSIYSGALAGSMAVQLGLSPFIVYNFNYLSVLAILINIPVIALTGIIVPLGLIASFLYGAPAELCYQSISGLCNILVMINNVAEIQGITTFVVPSPPIGVVAAYYMILLMVFSEAGRRIIKRNGIKALTILLCIAIGCGVLFGKMADDGYRRAELVFVDVGQGSCMHIRTSGGNYLIDGGGSDNYNVGKSILKPYLLKNGVKSLDGAFVTHLHTDHYKGICELAKEGMVKRIYIYEANRLRESEILEETSLSRDQIVYIYGGQTVKLGDASVKILTPQKQTEAEYARLLANENDENSISLIMNVKLKCGKLLVTGDINEEGEEKLISDSTIRSQLDADILQVAHHGSKYSSSTAFLQTVNPSCAVIPVGRNTYGHPTADAIDRLSDVNAKIYRTDIMGAVMFKQGRSCLVMCNN